MKQQELDRAIQEIRNEVVDDAVVRATAKRVFSGLFDSTLHSYQVDRIRGCSDFRMLIPPYLSHTLPAARTMLLEDHVRQCVACRHELEKARRGVEPGSAVVSIDSTPRSRPHVLAWAMAAALAIGIGVGVVGARNGLLPGQHAVRATVDAVDGRLYQITEFGARLVAVGDVIRNADQLRTAKGSRAILRLMNGAKVELAERSDVSISRTWKGTTVNVDQGRVIVASPEPTQSSLYLSSGAVVIPVNEAVLALDSGIKGARISLAKGSARFEQGAKVINLSASDQNQYTTDKRMGYVPVSDQFSWSQNASTYAALLGEFSTLNKQIQNIPSQELRYSSNLAKFVPANTVIYAAIPNVGGTIAEAKRLFDARLGQSEVLQEWWAQQSGANRDGIDRAVTQLTTISKFLGNEIVLAVPSTGLHQYGKPVFLAELSQPGLADYLQQNVPASAGLRIVGASSTAADTTGQLFLDLENNIVVASTDLAALQAVEASITTGAGSTFLQSPFFARIAQSYSAGAGYLLAADMEQMNAKSVTTAKGPLAGFSNVQYLVLERRGATDGTETRASLSFSGDRTGIASWLGTPGPIGSIGFISPDASFAVALIMKNPRAIATEVMDLASQGNPQFAEQMANFESQAGVRLVDDIAAPLGSDVSFATDGPLLPLPTWKFAMEVNDPDHLKATLNTLINRFNQTPPDKTGRLILAPEQVGSRTFYSVHAEKAPELAIYYTFVDGYLVASNGEAALSQAIQNRQSGYTLASSPNFRSQLPADNFSNFSAILYNNLGPTLNPIANQLKGTNALSSSQQQAVAALATSAIPGLICIYGEPDRIVAATRGSFAGFNLGTLAGLQEGKPLLPLIASTAAGMRGPGQRQSKN